MPAKPSNTISKAAKTKSVISFTQTLQKDIYNRVSVATKEKGFAYEQDIIRLAVIQFLERNGY